MPLDEIISGDLDKTTNELYKKQNVAGIPKNKFEFYMLPKGASGMGVIGTTGGASPNMVLVGSFKSISGLDADVEQLSWQTGDSSAEMKLPGKISHTNITLERGFIENKTLPRQWFNQRGSVAGQSSNYMLDCCIVVKSNSGDPVKLILVRNAWVVKYKPSDLQADSLDPWTESIELAHEGWAFSNDSKTHFGGTGDFIGDQIWSMKGLPNVYTKVTGANFYSPE